MKPVNYAAAIALALVSISWPAAADEGAECLECHEPAEDWAGISQEEWMKAAMNPKNKRHKDHMDLTEDQLKAIFAELAPK